MTISIITIIINGLGRKGEESVKTGGAGKLEVRREMRAAGSDGSQLTCGMGSMVPGREERAGPGLQARAPGLEISFKSAGATGSTLWVCKPLDSPATCYLFPDLWPSLAISPRTPLVANDRNPTQTRSEKKRKHLAPSLGRPQVVQAPLHWVLGSRAVTLTSQNPAQVARKLSSAPFH